MGLGVGLFLVAAGAILAFAVTGSPSGLDIVATGWILMVVGVLMSVLSVLFWESWAGRGYWRRREYVETGPVTRRRTTIDEDV